MAAWRAASVRREVLAGMPTGRCTRQEISDDGCHEDLASRGRLMWQLIKFVVATIRRHPEKVDTANLSKREPRR